MAEEVNFQIRIRATEEGEPKNLTIAELGVLLTGINRAINKASTSGRAAGYSPLSQEPIKIRSEITSVENGSILFSVVTSVSDFVRENVIQTTFLAGILGNAAWDFTKILSKEIRRALNRVGNEAAQVTERIEPVLGLNQGTVSEESKAASLQSPMRDVADASERSNELSSRPKTIYSFSFEQNGSVKIAVSYSAIKRV